MKFMPNAANQQFVRFLFMGAVSTALMYVLYLLFCMALNYQLAFLLAYIIAVIAAYYLNAIYVFKKKVSMQAFLRFPLVYVLQYGIGALFLGIFVEKFGVPKTIAPLVIIALTMPISFVLIRYVLTKY